MDIRIADIAHLREDGFNPGATWTSMNVAERQAAAKRIGMDYADVVASTTFLRSQMLPAVPYANA